MPDSSSPKDDTSTTDSFFEAVTEDASEDDDADRVQQIKRTLFDLSYLVMNADGTEHVSEKMLVRKLESRMEREGSVDVEARADELKPLLEEGTEAIRERAVELAEELADQAGDQTEALGGQFLELLKGLIVADANVATEEYELFESVCNELGIQKELPEP